MGSEMCIRDRLWQAIVPAATANATPLMALVVNGMNDVLNSQGYTCLLYTSDAADERSMVELGGRRIIQKKKKNYQQRLRGHHIHGACAAAEIDRHRPRSVVDI